MTALTEIHWFAIQARPRPEATADCSLRSLSMETLLPLVRRAVRHATRAARLVVRPLFPGYLFARFCAADLLRAVIFSRGVVRVLGAGDRPLPVDDRIIASICGRIGAEGFVQFEECRLDAGDPVRITAGPLTGWSGVFERTTSDSRRVQILLQTVQQCRLVVAREWVESAASV